jgi:hypothetical protein
LLEGDTEFEKEWDGDEKDSQVGSDVKGAFDDLKIEI